ncbi:peptidoglycan-binding domain-containing protein [Streptomyces sp. NPDC004284]|uniref:peptidoglycan-binding domain-containing protein n=1 Tax=Streptomyces sp. NPDC004284 TaxID=3364695 RepID=UPI0036B346CE
MRIVGWAAGSAQPTFVSLNDAFGPGAEAALRRFQAAYGLTVDGVAGHRRSTGSTPWKAPTDRPRTSTSPSSRARTAPASRAAR